MAAVDMPTEAQLTGITTVAQAIAWVGLEAGSWAAVDVALGSLQILGALRLAVHAARIAVPEHGTAGEPGHTPASERGLTVRGVDAGGVALEGGAAQKPEGQRGALPKPHWRGGAGIQSTPTHRSRARCGARRAAEKFGEPRSRRQ